MNKIKNNKTDGEITLNVETQEKIEVCMAYFHPKEKIFNDDRIESKMLEALTAFSNEVGTSNKETIKLREMWFSRDRAGMYKFLDKYITL